MESLQTRKRFDVIPLCLCGCGKPVNINNNTRLNRFPKYIIGHNPHGKKDLYKYGKKFKEGQNHPLWKEKPSYQALHTWVRRHKNKPNNCEKCGKSKKRLEAANISGKYKRDINDYIYVCNSCHNIMDGRVNNFKNHVRGVLK